MVRASLFIYKGKKYIINSTKKVDCIGDFCKSANKIYIDKNIHKRFHEGIAIHEIEERKFMEKGCSYSHSHNLAQKKEMWFYQSKFGSRKAKELMKDEERLVLELFLAYTAKDLKKLNKKDSISYNIKQ